VTATEQLPTAASTGRIGPLVDCDVHTPVPTLAALARWLPAHWTEYMQGAGFAGSGAVARSYPPGAAPSGGPEVAQTVGPDATQARARLSAHLDRTGARYAILNCFYGLETIKNPDLSVELARAVNEWLRAEWLDHDPRFRASIVVTPNDAAAAAEEIERTGDDTRFVQVLLPARAEQPYGHRRFFPLHDVAAARGLPLAIHFGGMPGTPPSPSGWNAYYLEDYVGMAVVFQTHVTSLIAEGALTRLPNLRIVLSEAGFSWVPSMLWRLDKEWKGLRREIPWVSEKPSTYFRTHFRGTLQPIDLPTDPAVVDEVLTHIGCDDYLLFATDFPHRHTTEPVAFLRLLPEGLRDAVTSGNARSIYRVE
jgi:uncharacterized protein